eukprot:5439144-Amphidinium_carterae.1
MSWKMLKRSRNVHVDAGAVELAMLEDDVPELVHADVVEDVDVLEEMLGDVRDVDDAPDPATLIVCGMTARRSAHFKG